MVRHGRSVGAILLALAACALSTLLLLQDPARAQTASLTITKDGPERVEPGQQFDYVLTVTNNTDEAIPLVTVTDNLPAGVEFVGSDPALCVSSEDVEADGRENVTCNLNNLGAGETATITLTVTAPTDSGQITNRASADNPADGAPAVNSERVNTLVAPNLEINKLDDPDPVSNPEDLLLYTLRVQNRGNTAVSDVFVTDDLPLDVVDFVEVESDDFVCDFTAGAVQCSPDRLGGDGVLGPGEIATVQIVVEPEVAGTITNRGDVFVSGIDDPVDTDIETTLVREPAVADEDDDPDDGSGSNDDGNNGNNGNERENRDVIVIVSGDGGGEVTVIKDTIPGKTLPDTGGTEKDASTAGTFLGAGFAVLLGAVVIRFARYRNP